MWRIIVLLILCQMYLSFRAVPVNAANLHLVDGSAQTIQRAIDMSSPGDTIVLPAGTFVLDQNVTINKSVTLAGAGSNRTILQRPNGAHFAISANNVRIYGISFKGIVRDGDVGTIIISKDVAINIGNVKDFTIVDCEFIDIGRAGVVVTGAEARGVIAKSRFINIYSGSGVVVYGQGNSNWNKPLELGTENAVFVEDTYFLKNIHAVASNNGSKYVFRHNEVIDSTNTSQAVDAHGLEYGSSRGSRSYEVYHNKIDNKMMHYAGVWMRGGDGVIFNNDFRKVTFGILLSNTTASGASFTYPAKDQTTVLYAWGNTTDGEESGVDVRSDHQHLFQADRDYFTKEMPGYKPFIYPHPLVVQLEADIRSGMAMSDPVFVLSELEAENGEYAIDISKLPVAPKRFVKLLVEVDGKLVESMEELPLPTRVTLQTADMENGHHELVISLLDETNGTSKVLTTFRTENWTLIGDFFNKPVFSAWLGTIDSSKVSEGSAGWDYADQPEMLFNDDGRKVSTGSSPEYMIWETPRLKSFAVTLYVAKGEGERLSALVKLATAEDDTDWHDVGYVASYGPGERDGWEKVVLTGEALQPADRFRLTFAGAAASDVVQVGEVAFKCRK